MASNSNPKVNEKWLKDNSVSVNEKGWYFLTNHRIAVWLNGAVNFIGSWDDTSMDKVAGEQNAES